MGPAPLGAYLRSAGMRAGGIVADLSLRARRAEDLSDVCGRPHRGAIASRLRSDAMENLRASHPCHAAIRGDVCRDPSCGNGRRADKASGPDRGRSAIWRPVPRRLEHNPRTSNAPCQIIGNSRTGARRTADENSGEISRGRVDCQNLQQCAPLTLPKGGEQALRRRRGNGSEKKKQGGNDTAHILPHLVAVRADSPRSTRETLIGQQFVRCHAYPTLPHRLAANETRIAKPQAPRRPGRWP